MKTISVILHEEFVEFSHLFPVTLKSILVTMCTTCFKIKILFILPTECMYMFYVVLTINSNCFPKQHSLFGPYNGEAVFPVRYELNVYKQLR
jgi:hypothetical protein